MMNVNELYHGWHEVIHVIHNAFMDRGQVQFQEPHMPTYVCAILLPLVQQ